MNIDINNLPSDIDLAGLIGLHRKHLGMTQKEYSFHYGVARSTISGWESGEYEPSPRAVVDAFVYFANENDRGVLALLNSNWVLDGGDKMEINGEWFIRNKAVEEKRRQQVAAFMGMLVNNNELIDN